MNNLFLIYKIAYLDGIKEAILDKNNNKKRDFKKLDSLNILSKIYDIAYIDGYNDFFENK